MKVSNLYTCASVAAVALSLVATSVQAAPAATAPAAAPAADNLDQIVVTASGRDKTKLNSSISVSSVSQQAIQNFTPRSETEILRLIPGLHAEDTAGPGGNANIGVRGIPVITGGSEFVQLQEDGLPTVLFGDIQFGNNDYWIRYDNSVERVEAVRGGGASTFASQAPGAVVNYINDTGRVEGGSVSIEKGVNFDENRLEFTLNHHINDTLRFHVGGFFKDGHGPTHIGYNASQGYQIKANLTQDFADNHGYIRLNFRRLDDREPTYTTSPSIVGISTSGGVTTINSFSPIPASGGATGSSGFDARNQSNNSIYNQNFQVVNSAGQLTRVNVEGIHPKATSFGGELHYEFDSHFSVDDNFRWTNQSGVFNTQFLNVATTASQTPAGGKLVFAAGPNLGQVYTGAYVNNNPNINTNVSDIGSLANNLEVTGKFDAGSGKVTAKGGWFHMRQTINQDWHVNPQLSTLDGLNPVPLDVFNAAGTQLSVAGQSGFNNNWGDCCARTVNLTYTDDAPYMSLNYNGGGLDLDGSIRFDSVRAGGNAQKVATDVAGNAIAGPSFLVRDALGAATLTSYVPNGPVEVLNYTSKYTSYSFGALYNFGGNTSVFARLSRGGRFNADRRTLGGTVCPSTAQAVLCAGKPAGTVVGGNFNADGSLTSQGAATSVNFVTQQELGVKHKGSVSGGSWNVELTGFRTQLTDNNYDFTAIGTSRNPVTSNVYHSYGLEFTGNLHMGNFSLYADATYSNAKIVASASTPASVGKTPHSTPSFQFLISPTYDAGIAAVGFTIDGQSSAYLDDLGTVKAKGQTYVNGFVKVRPMTGLEVGLSVNNLFNTLGYRGSGSINPISATQAIYSNSAVLGRTISASVRYKF